MKKYISLIILISILLLSQISFAYSEEFETMIDIMGIERQTKNGYILNEEIYNQYNQFVYGSPLDIKQGQRWKNVEKGLWTKNGGAWNGTGTRGEYWVLGYNVFENEIHNHKFPVDIEPPTPPTSWRYVELLDAASSWNDISKYLDQDQKNYMLNSKLMRNDVTYDLTATDIGLAKARVENFATWKTNGNIYTRRYDMNNKEWAANFIVPPMAADADIESYMNFSNGKEYTISKDENILQIPIEYGADVVNLTDYSKKEHVKILKSQLYVDGNLISEVSDKKILHITDDNKILIDKNIYSENEIELEVMVKSVLLTEFFADGALVDIKREAIKINIEVPKEENIQNDVKGVYDSEFDEFPPPEITNIILSRIENNTPKELPIAKKTNTKFICAGQVLQIDLKAVNLPERISLQFEGNVSINTLDDLTKKFEWEDPVARKTKKRYSTLEKLKEQYDGVVGAKVIKEYSNGDKDFRITYVIPYKTKQTLHSWSTLRELSNDAFNIDETRLFSRIQKPYELVFKVSGPLGKTTKRVKLDVFERWDTLYNRDLTPYIKK